MTTANATAASLMVMDEDQSVFVRYADGSTLHVSPCGAEFTVLLRAPAAHPLRASQPVRQRTRFAISTYKPFFSADSEAHWPHVSSCEVERGLGGDTTTTTTIVRSVEGRASLTLSSSGEDFLVEFLCSISQPEPDVMRNNNIRKDTAAAAATGLGTGGPVAKPKATPQSKGCRGTSQPKHHSCSSVAPMWRYPLSVARRYRAAAAAHRNRVTPGDPSGEESDGATKLKEEEEEEEDRRRCPVPEALPLRCPSPHQHRSDTLFNRR
ncbi:hypothetical protein CRUP_026604 [Coryphaenoides rupestris]|nr:hypothetical protein CRUP_026604 [Coryphaenoides rupestris]